MSTETEKKPSTAVVLSMNDQLAALDKLAEEKNIVALQQQGAFVSAIGMAQAIHDLRLAITDEILAPIMALQGSALGFKTDKDSAGGYPKEVVKEAFIEATLRGFKMVGNQTNIIASRFYATKEGFEARFRDLSAQGLITDLKLKPSVPRIVNDGAIVVYSASWKWRNKPDSIDALEIPIKVNKGMGDDAILGKAKRKILAAIFSRVTGTETSDGDATEPAIDVTASPVKEKPAAATGLPADLLADLDVLVGPYEEQTNAWLRGSNFITPAQTYRDVTPELGRRIIKQRSSFLTSIGVNK